MLKLTAACFFNPVNQKTIRMKKVSSLYTVANFLTGFRILLTPCIVYLIAQSNHTTALVFFIIGVLTDLFDGLAARLLNECSEVGEILDPIADKIFLSGTLSALAWVTHGPSLIPSWFVTVLLVRETTLLVAGSLVLRSGLGISLEPTRWGKLSTAALMTVVSILYWSNFLYAQAEPLQLPEVIWVLLATLSVGSGVHYLARGCLVVFGRSLGLK